MCATQDDVCGSRRRVHRVLHQQDRERVCAGGTAPRAVQNVSGWRKKNSKPLSDSTNFHLYSKDDLEIGEGLDVYSIRKQDTPRSNPVTRTESTISPGGTLLSPGTPGRYPDTPTWKSPAATHAYAQRPQRNVVQVALNGDVSRVEGDAKPMDVDSGVTTERLQVELLEGGIKTGTRFMYEQLQDTVSAMESRILAFAEALKEHLGIEDFLPVHTATQEKGFIVGRVVCDGEGRLNERAVLIEGSVKYSGGKRIRLELRDVPRFSLFPGQVVAAEGFNPSGHCFTATKLYTSSPAPVSQIPPANTSAQPLSIVIASGPFCCSEDVDYTPLKDLLGYVEEQKADMVLLVGPFVDAEHPAVKSGALDVTVEYLFAEMVQSQLEELC